MSNHLEISIGSTSFKVTLDDNTTGVVFKVLLSMTVNMSEMNGNEKYYYLLDGYGFRRECSAHMGSRYGFLYGPYGGGSIAPAGRV